MVIRRVIDSLRSRNFSVFAVELMVVIVGVFIGIQVSNWNDARINRNRAHSYLERIGADLDADIVNYRNRLEFWEDVSAYGAVGLGYASTGNTGDLTNWDLLLAYFQASQLAEFFTTETTYDEIKSSGELGLIGDLKIRNQLARYYTHADNPVLSERPAYREHVRGLIPLHVQNYIWETCYWSNVENQQLIDCEAPIKLREAATLVEAISGNEQLISELRYWMSTMRVAQLIGNDRAVWAEELRNIVHETVDGVSTLENP